MVTKNFHSLIYNDYKKKLQILIISYYFKVTISSALEGWIPIVLSKSLFFRPLTTATEKP